jgi:hypothetical protein
MHRGLHQRGLYADKLAPKEITISNPRRVGEVDVDRGVVDEQGLVVVPGFNERVAGHGRWREALMLDKQHCLGHGRPFSALSSVVGGYSR